MAYATVRSGSRGDDVRQLQQLLNQRGYGLDVDGIFGTKTQSAVRDWQRRSGLTVDGIVGKNTWGSLTGGTLWTGSGSSGGGTSGNMISGGQYAGLSGVSGTTSAGLRELGNGYTPSQSVQQAKDYLQQIQSSAPEPYESKYDAQLQEIYNKIMNREPFAYDLNGDALYHQYAELYRQQGKQAMADTMGQAAALTGGYGNSYAATAGNQAYQSYMQALASRVPELHQMALDRYNAEGAEMMNQYSLTRDMDEAEYGRYRDSVGDWMNERQYAQSAYESERKMDYGTYADRLQYLMAMAQLENQDYWTGLEWAQAGSRSGGGGSSGRSGSGGSGGDGGDETVKLKGTKGTVTLKGTNGTRKFIASVLGNNEWKIRSARNSSYGETYSDYIESVLRRWSRQGRLTEAETLYLMDYYNL